MRKTPDLYEKDDVQDYQYCPGRYAVSVYPGFIGKECDCRNTGRYYCERGDRSISGLLCKILFRDTGV